MLSAAKTAGFNPDTIVSQIRLAHNGFPVGRTMGARTGMPTLPRCDRIARLP